MVILGLNQMLDVVNVDVVVGDGVEERKGHHVVVVEVGGVDETYLALHILPF